MKKLATLLLAAIMVLSVCGFATAESIDGNGAVIRILTPQNSRVTWENNEYTKWIEESCNVKLQFTFLPETDTEAKFTAMVAADELKDYDVINYHMNLTKAKAYADQGVFMNVAKYFEDGLAVNCDAAVAKYPDMYLISNITTADGEIFGIPKIQASPSNEVKYKMWVNEQWLKNLDIEVPTTTEEFYDMLVRFKNEDANGNGDPDDEIPFITSTGFGGTATKFLTNAFVFEGDNDMFILDDGHVSVSYVQDGWFEACDYLKKLCDEGLLSPESFTYNNDSLKAVACLPEDIVGVVTNSSCAFMGASNDPIRLRYICLNPLTGPEGVCYASYAASTTETCWFVTPWANDPELCFKVGDFQFTEEGFLRGRFGLEGENWMTKEDYLAANPNAQIVARYGALGYDGEYVFYNDIRDMTDIPRSFELYWYEHMPYFSGEVEANGMTFVTDENGNEMYSLATNGTCRQETGTAYYQLVKPGADVYVPTLAFTAEEVEVLAEMQTALKNYVNEQRTKYIIGDVSDLADRDQFVQNLKDTFQLDRFLEIADAAYQRQYAD